MDSYLDFCFFVSFFPQLVAGPIVRASVFIPQIRKDIIVTREDLGRGMFLIISGLFKKAIIANYISINFVDRIFSNPLQFSGVENLFGVYTYALQIYCDFSGYSDMAIGIALLMGFKLATNFDSPYQSVTITEFWRRWHISLSSWLRDYLYIPLGGNKKGKVRTYINLFLTMLLGGLWHGANWKFVFWGAMHGSALAVEKMFNLPKRLNKNKVLKITGIIITFHFVCFCWIFFRADSFKTSMDMINQILFSFNGYLLLQLIDGYRAIFVLLVIGFALHFTPKNIELKAEKWVVDMNLVSKAVLITALIWLIMQVKSSDIQPFIYFQF